MSEWMKGLISGVIATVIGFLLQMIWDTVKYNREVGQQDEAVMTAVKEELLANISILKTNMASLQQELDVIEKQQEVVNPLNLLQGGFWDLVKIRLPRKISKDANLLTKIREVAQSTNNVNETIRSRENYRLHNGAMTNFHSRMKVYDRILLQSGAPLLNALEELNRQF